MIHECKPIKVLQGSATGELLRIVAHTLIQFNLNVLLEDCLLECKAMNMPGEKKH
jgi:hypothetical protein